MADYNNIKIIYTPIELIEASQKIMQQRYKKQIYIQKISSKSENPYMLYIQEDFRLI